MQADSTSMEKRRCTGWRTTWRRLPKDHSKQNPTNLSNTSKPRLFYPRPFHGNCFRSRSKWGEDRRLRWRVTGPLSGEVLSKGFPCRYYDWRMLDEQFERGFRQRAKQFTQSGRPPKRNGRDQKTPDGRSSDRITYLQRRASTTARLPSMQAMARRESGRGKGNPHPVRFRTASPPEARFHAKVCDSRSFWDWRDRARPHRYK